MANSSGQVAEERFVLGQVSTVVVFNTEQEYRSLLQRSHRRRLAFGSGGSEVLLRLEPEAARHEVAR